MLALPRPLPRKRPSLTPMIDVVFLLLVFFMLASQFGIDRALSLNAGGTAQAYAGPPRLVTIEANAIYLNGALMRVDALVAGLTPLMQSPQDAIVLKPDDKAPLQAMMDVASALNAAGFTQLLVLE